MVKSAIRVARVAIPAFVWIPLKEKSEISVIGGKHSGAQGKILKIIPEHKMVEVESEKEKFNVLIKQIMITK